MRRANFRSFGSDDVTDGSSVFSVSSENPSLIINLSPCQDINVYTSESYLYRDGENLTYKCSFPLQYARHIMKRVCLLNIRSSSRSDGMVAGFVPVKGTNDKEKRILLWHYSFILFFFLYFYYTKIIFVRSSYYTFDTDVFKNV
ncbi:hypothetical protein PUN28_014669 [Cardiocondyla obscurior]|uniref:Uncharacterized protein n=1 Tax=Cardiocondyla obscurior TaxID=286306 RepID=A0AAW2EYK6_9HYME